MYVKNHMLSKEKLTVLDVNENVSNALKKIEEGDFLSLPVFDGEDFKGILMKEAVYRFYFESNCQDKNAFLEDTKVKDVYNENYKRIREDELIENASYLLKELRTPFLPVFNSKDDFVGILTHFSIFNAFSEVFGFGQGTKIVVNMFDTPGQLARLTEIIRKENINIINFTIMDAKVLGVYRVILRVDTNQPEDLIDKISRAGFKIGDIGK